MAGHLGINHHTDAGALTVLLQDSQAGLQVLHGGGWSTIAPAPGCLLINIGDIVQVWSNDAYRAPLPSACGTSDAPRYRAINWGEFRAARGR